MRFFKKKTISFAAALLAALSLLQSGSPACADSTGTADSGITYWGTSLPTNGDRDYNSDSSWYRLILEWGSYCTNSTDSSGAYVSPDTSTATSWPGISGARVVQAGTLSVADDYNFYRNGEYSTEMYSLYIKYAGRSKSGKDCWYISPCDENGSREKRLWALDCSVNICDNFGGLTSTSRYVTDIFDGIPSPEFTLLTPTFDEYSKMDIFNYASMYIPDYNNNDGTILADYCDNNKWIIESDGSGSWSIRSAGYVDWDWTDNDGTFRKLYGSDDDAASALANGVGHLSLILDSVYTYDVSGINVTGFLGETYKVAFSYLPTMGKLANAFDGNTDNLEASLLSLMLYLSDYAENVYITGGTRSSGTKAEGFSDISNDKSAEANRLYATCAVTLSMDHSSENYKKYEDCYKAKGTEAANMINRGNAPDLLYISTPRETLSIQAAGLTVDEIKAQVPITVTGSGGGSVFSGVYVGTCLTANVIENDLDYSVGYGVTMIMGAEDKDGDGICNGAGIIGDIYSDYSSSGGKVIVAPVVTVQAGGTLQIDGPTYAAAKTKIIVQGSLVISSGAFLTVGNSVNYFNKFGVAGGIDIVVDGGSVYIASGAGLNQGFGSLTVQNGGAFVNDGVFIKQTEVNYSTGKTYDSAVYSPITLDGGSIENGKSGRFINGAAVYNEQIMSLIRGASSLNAVNFYNITKYISDMRDDSLGSYSAGDSRQHVTFLMKNTSKGTNVFRNEGLAYILGELKGSSASGTSDGTIIGTSGIYRYVDLCFNQYVSTSYNSSVIYHQHAIQENSNPNTNSTLLGYYAYTGLETTEEGIIPDSGAETKAEENNLYALRVGTGSQGTSKISGFIIGYVDKNGKSRTQTVSPANLCDTYDFAVNWQYCGTGENQSGTSKLKNNALDGEESFDLSKTLSCDNISTSLESVSNNTYLFQTVYPVKYITSISIKGTGTGSWTCTELNVYRVKYLYPVEEYGYRSSDWFIPFTGTLLAETVLNTGSDGTKYINFSWNSEEIGIGDGDYALKAYEVPSGVSSLTDASGFTYYSASTETVPYSTSDKEYTFSVTLADTNDGGIKALYNNDSDIAFGQYFSKYSDRKEKVYNEITLNLQITYVDTNGAYRRATMPLVISAVEWAYNNMTAAERKSYVHGIFQQGEEVVFRGVLPDFDYATEAALTYSYSEGDSIAVTAIAISDSNYTAVSVEDGVLEVDHPETAVSFYKANSTSGVKISSGQTMSVSMKKWNGTESLKPQATGSRYLVVVQTDSMVEAGTVNDVKVSFTYKNLSGLSATTSVYSLQSLVDDYYGYWPVGYAPYNNDYNCGYKLAVSPGGTMYFVIELSNVYKFTSATFTLDTTSYDPGDASAAEAATDEWQMSGITIYELEELGQRQVILGRGVSTPVTTNRTYYRDNIYGSRGAVNSAKGPLMVSPGESKTISLEDGNVSGGGEIINKNSATDVKELSYDDTKQDFGFTTKRCKYTVMVQVAGDSITSVEDGDCGSQNKFYFQLVFQDEDGKTRTSPCVLSNQQLQSDGFRTGTMEQFAIYTNDDYGTPVQINIIPDDTSSASDVFDKLKIDYISVCKTSGTGVNLSWRAENVGWIDIEYKDDAEEQSGRSDEELIRSYELKEMGYSVVLEFAIETAAVADSGKDQFKGQVLADITYRDTSGVVKTIYNVDVVSEIADYANKSSSLPDTPVSGSQESIPEFMFKSGYTNRFQYTFDDISSLIRVKLKATAENSTTWYISRVSARQVFDEGTLTFNVFGEYERYYSIDPQDLTASNNASTVAVETVAGSQVSSTFNLNSGNSIKVDLTEGEETVNVNEGESEGLYDEISMTAEFTSPESFAAGTVIPVRLMYKNIYGDAYAVNATLVYDSTTNKFMIPQTNLPETPNFGVPYQIELTGSAAVSGAVLDAVIVNQVRDRQVIEKFTFAPDTGTKLEADSVLTLLLSESEQDEYAQRKGYTSENQIVYLQLGQLTEKTLLTETNDLQVAIVYTEKDDPYSYEHISSYVSALSAGYTIITKDDVIRIPMSVGNVGTVKSLMVKVGNTGMKVNIQKGCIAFSETSNVSGSVLSTGWVNLPAATGLVSDEGTAMNTDGLGLEAAMAAANRVSPIKLDLTFSKIGRSDTNAKITVNYLNSQSTALSTSYEMAASDWNRDGVWILTDGIKSILYYTVEVSDKDTTNTATATLSKVELSWYSTAGTYVSSSYSASQALEEGTASNTAVLSTRLTGEVKTDSNSVLLENNHVNDGRTEYDTLTVTGTEYINISAYLSGCPGDLRMRVLDSSGTVIYGTVAAAAESESITDRFSLPINATGLDKTYTLEVYSSSMSFEYKSIIYIVQKSPVSMDGVVIVDGGPENGFTTIYGDKTSGTYTVSSSSVIEVYVRTNDGSAVTPQTDGVTAGSPEYGVTLSTWAGTWTKYTFTVTEGKEDLSIKLIPEANAEGSYSIILNCPQAPES